MMHLLGRRYAATAGAAVADGQALSILRQDFNHCIWRFSAWKSSGGTSGWLVSTFGPASWRFETVVSSSSGSGKIDLLANDSLMLLQGHEVLGGSLVVQ
jgi:hypothetical protein